MPITAFDLTHLAKHYGLKTLSLVTYVLLPAGFKTDHVLFFAVKLNSAKVISFSGHQFSELEYLRILKNAGLKDPLVKSL